MKNGIVELDLTCLLFGCPILASFFLFLYFQKCFIKRLEYFVRKHLRSRNAPIMLITNQSYVNCQDTSVTIK